MKNHLFLLLCVTMLAGGCAGTPTQVHSGKVKAQTFSFVKTSQASRFPQADHREHVNAAIQAAIKQNLQLKGLTHLPEGGDVTVAYLVIVGNNATTTAINDHFGYGRDYSDLREKAHKAATIDNKNPNYFEVGTLLIDIIDPKSGELLYRDFGYREMLKNLPENTRRAKLQAVVDQILAKLRFVK